MKDRRRIALLKAAKAQIDWVLECGGDIKGYEEKYTQNVQEIYDADTEELKRKLRLLCLVGV